MAIREQARIYKFPNMAQHWWEICESSFFEGLEINFQVLLLQEAILQNQPVCEESVGIKCTYSAPFFSRGGGGGGGGDIKDDLFHRNARLHALSRLHI